MKKQSALFIAITAIVVGSCKVVGTLYPMSQSENDFVFKKEIIGKWSDLKDPSGYYSVDTVSGKNGKLYLIETVFNKKGKNTADTTRFNGFLVRMSGWYYLDCWLAIEKELNVADKIYEDVLIARHFIFRLSFPEANTLEMAAPDTEELIKLIDEKKISLHYANLKKDDYLILDKPEILQKRIMELIKYPSLYKNINVLHRLK